MCYKANNEEPNAWANKVDQNAWANNVKLHTSENLQNLGPIS